MAIALILPCALYGCPVDHVNARHIQSLVHVMFRAIFGKGGARNRELALLEVAEQAKLAKTNALVAAAESRP